MNLSPVQTEDPAWLLEVLNKLSCRTPRHMRLELFSRPELVQELLEEQRAVACQYGMDDAHLDNTMTVNLQPVQVVDS